MWDHSRLDRQSMDADWSSQHWPALIDLLTATLMVFVLVTFLRSVVFTDELEVLLIRQKQAVFEEIFSAAVAEDRLELTRGFNFIQLTFRDDVLFESGRHELTSERGRQLLDDCARGLVEACAVVDDQVSCDRIQVEGHTDDVPVRAGRREYPRSNWELSSARATSVVTYLLERAGNYGALLPELFSASGYGQFHPVDSNATEPGRALNRRIEIRVIFSGQQVESH